MSTRVDELFVGAIATARFERVKAAVEAALDEKIHYDDEMNAYVDARCRAHDEAVENFLGIFDEPSDTDEQYAWRRDISLRVKASPRGTWAIMRITHRGTGATLHAPVMSDGSGSTATGGSYDKYDGMPTYEHIYARMTSFETYMVRKHVEEARGLAADLAAIDNYSFVVGRTLKNVDLGYQNGKHNRIEITQVDRESGKISFNLIKRGSSKRYTGSLSARSLPSKANLL